MLDKKAAINVAEKYADIVKKEYSPFAVVLFGSYVNGSPHEDSDIDVGIVFDGFSGDRLETSKELWKLRREISFDIEPHLLDRRNDKSGFVEHVFKTGNII
ncbi:MAG: nucleotidyltransferase domain-containing protein [Oscillospiraceae bacterium]|nr:nucleotidyltransferase domain-containing protein [Oscillospiraceae bacterium]